MHRYLLLPLWLISSTGVLFAETWQFEGAAVQDLGQMRRETLFATWLPIPLKEGSTPQARGTFVRYQHEGLTYFFGPYLNEAQAREAEQTLTDLQTRLIELDPKFETSNVSTVETGQPGTTGGNDLPEGTPPQPKSENGESPSMPSGAESSSPTSSPESEGRPRETSESKEGPPESTEDASAESSSSETSTPSGEEATVSEQSPDSAATPEESSDAAAQNEQAEAEAEAEADKKSTPSEEAQPPSTPTPLPTPTPVPTPSPLQTPVPSATPIPLSAPEAATTVAPTPSPTPDIPSTDQKKHLLNAQRTTHFLFWIGVLCIISAMTGLFAWLTRKN